MSIFSVPSYIQRLSKTGFTLIELIVVITIMGVLSTFLFANFVNSQQRGRDQQRKTDLQNIRTSLESIKLDKGRYPSVSDSIGYPTDCGTSHDLKSGSTVYMRNVPCDPSGNGYWNNGEYFYCTDPDAFSYAIFACLENTTNDNEENTTDNLSELTLPSGCSVPASCAKYYYITSI